MTLTPKTGKVVYTAQIDDLADFLEPAEPAPMDAARAEEIRQRRFEEEIAAAVKTAANIIAGNRQDVALTIEGTVISVVAANRAGNNDQWIIALDTLGSVLKAIAQREGSLAHEARIRQEDHQRHISMSHRNSRPSFDHRR